MNLYKQEILDIINEGLVSVKEYVQNTYTIKYDPEYGRDIDITSQARGEFMTLINEISDDYTSDIASNILEKEFNPTEKQAWALAYQVMNNKEKYINKLK